MKKKIGIIIAVVAVVIAGAFFIQKGNGLGNGGNSNTAVKNSVKEYSDLFGPSGWEVDSTIAPNDYQTLRFYATDVVLASVVSVDGVKVKGDEKIYQAKELLEAYPELKAESNKQPTDREPIKVTDVTTIWHLRIVEAIDSEAGMKQGKKVTLETLGLPHSEVGSTVNVRDNDILVFALKKDESTGNYTAMPMNDSYFLNNTTTGANKSKEEVEPYVEFKKLVGVPKDELVVNA